MKRYTEEKQMKVLVVGPDSRRTKGGIASVIQGMREDKRLTEEAGMGFYSSCYAGSPLLKAGYELYKILKFDHAVQDYDLVHIHMSVKGSALRKMKYAQIAKKHGKKVILHIHSGNFLSYYRGLSGKKQKALRDCLQSADCVIALSQSWKKALSAGIGLSNCVALPNGISLAGYPKEEILPFERRPVDFLFLGRLGAEKGTDNILKALENLKASGHRFNCVLAGDGSVQDYSQWVKEAGMEGQISFAGWVQGEQKRKLLREARILLLPSRNEGMPMSILEAMAFGEAVISTKVGGIPEAVEDDVSGVLIEPDNEEKLRATIDRLLDDHALAERMGRRGREIVEQKFDLRQIHSELLAIYRRVLGE